MKHGTKTGMTEDAEHVDAYDKIGVQIWIMLILLAVGMVLMTGSGGWGQMRDQETRVVLQEGQVTGKGSGSIQINNKDYKLATEVTIQDDAERPRTFNDIKEGMPILFHLKREQVDKLVIILPR